VKDAWQSPIALPTASFSLLYRT